MEKNSEEKVPKYVEEYLKRKIPFLERYVQLKRFVDILYDVQDIRKSTESRERGMPQGTEGVFSGALKNVEKNITERIDLLLEDLPEYENVFKGIKGIGPRLAGSWISNIMIRFISVPPKELENFSDIQQQYAQKTRNGRYLVPTIRGIAAFPNVSSLWSWCGQLPYLKRTRAHGDVEGGWVSVGKDGVTEKNVKINPRMQTLAWKTSGQFVRSRVKTDVFYGKVYETYKDFLTNHSRYAVALQDPKFCPRYETCLAKLKGRANKLGRDPKKFPCLKHIDNMARRNTVKDFIRDIFVTWRKSEGLPIPPAYDPDHKHHDEV